MKKSIIFILIVLLFFFLIFKAVKFLFPLLVPVLIFFGIYLFLNSLFGAKKKIPAKNDNQREVVKDVEIRVIDDDDKEAPSKKPNI